MNKFKNIGVAKKIGVLALIMFIMLLTIGVTAVVKVSDMNGLLVNIYQGDLTPIVNLETVKSDIEFIRAKSNDLLDAGNDDALKAPIEQEIIERTDLLKADMEVVTEVPNFQLISEAVDNFLVNKDAFIESHGVGTVSNMGPGLDVTEATTEITTTSEVTSTTESATTAESGVNTEMSVYDDARESVINLLEGSIQLMVEEAKTTYQSSESNFKEIVVSTTALVLTSLLMMIFLTIIIGRSIVKPLNAVTKKLHEIAESEGNLTQRIEVNSNDELGKLSHSFNAFVERLNNIIRETKVASKSIDVSSDVVKTVTSNTTQSMEILASTIVEIAASSANNAKTLELMSTHIEESTKFSNDTAIISFEAVSQATKTKESAIEGSKNISEVVTAMSDIALSSKGVTNLVGELETSSKQIGDIIVMISNISDQTNLLALNASIEAARAGEAGRGFNVVATEIKKLADESKKASIEIASLVKDNQKKSNDVVGSVENVSTKINSGEKIAKLVDESISKIIDGIEELAIKIDLIKTANTKIAENSVEVEESMAQMVTASNQIAQGTETISGGIEEQLSAMIELDDASLKLNQLSKSLNDIIGGFKI